MSAQRTYKQTDWQTDRQTHTHRGGGREGTLEGIIVSLLEHNYLLMRSGNVDTQPRWKIKTITTFLYLNQVNVLFFIILYLWKHAIKPCLHIFLPIHLALPVPVSVTAVGYFWGISSNLSYELRWHVCQCPGWNLRGGGAALAVLSVGSINFINVKRWW